MNPLTSLSGLAAIVGAAGIITVLAACGEAAPPKQTGIDPKKMSDAIHAVIEADRSVYTKNVVNRLAKEEKIIKATEKWKDDKTLPLPAQMLRMGAEAVAEKNMGFSYSLQSLWPINKQNAPKTEAEKAGLDAVLKSGQPYYAEETLGGKKYLTSVYADKGVAAACVDCHNDHKDSPKTDFKLGDVMGGVVIRIPLE